MPFLGPAFASAATGFAIASMTVAVTKTVTKDRGLILLITKPNSGVNNVTGVADSNGGTWAQVVSGGSVFNGRVVDIWWRNSIASGSLTVTATWNTLATSNIELIELTKYAAVDTYDSFQNTSATNTYYSASTTKLDTIANAFLVAACCTNADTGTFSPGSGLTLSETDNSTRANQYGEFESAQTDNRCLFTSAGTNRIGPGICASFKEDSPPSSGVQSRRRRESQRQQSL